MSISIAQPESMEDLALRLQRNRQMPMPPDVAAPVTMGGGQPDLSIVPKAKDPIVFGPHGGITGPVPPKGTLEGNKVERNRMVGSGAGVDQISSRVQDTGFGQTHPLAAKVLGGLAQGVAKLGDIGLSAIAPSLAINIPGTEYHHMMQEHQLNKQISQQEGEQEKEAQTANLQAQPDLAQQRIDETVRAHDQQLRTHGLKVDEATGQVVPDTESPVYMKQQLANELTASTIDLRNAQADVEAAKNDPNSPQFQLAQQRLAIAQQTQDRLERLVGARQLQATTAYGNYLMHSQGVDMHGNSLPGAMLTDEGGTVGSSFQGNIRPTGQQRNKADMAASADQQIEDMKSIVAKRPDIFGPAAGRVTDFNVWLGSQDPDAQRFRAARTIAGDHLAGTFGGRSEAALNALDAAIGHFRDNPAAVEAGLNQLKEANHLFLQRGTVHTVGGNNSEPSKNSPKPEGEVLGTTNKPDGVYEMNGKNYRVKGGKVYAH